MSALQQDQVGTAVLAHRASPMGFLSPAFEPIDLEERLQIDNCCGRTQTGPSGNFCHLCSFQEKQILQAEEFPAFHSQGISPPPLSFFFFYQGGRFSLPRLQIAEGGTGHWVVSLFPSISSVPKEDAQLQGTNTDTLELLIPPFFFLQDPPGWIHFLLWEIKWHSRGGGVSDCFYQLQKMVSVPVYNQELIIYNHSVNFLQSFSNCCA